MIEIRVSQRTDPLADSSLMQVSELSSNSGERGGGESKDNSNMVPLQNLSTGPDWMVKTHRTGLHTGKRWEEM